MRPTRLSSRSLGNFGLDQGGEMPGVDLDPELVHDLFLEGLRALRSPAGVCSHSRPSSKNCRIRVLGRREDVRVEGVDGEDARFGGVRRLAVVSWSSMVRSAGAMMSAPAISPTPGHRQASRREYRR